MPISTGTIFTAIQHSHPTPHSLHELLGLLRQVKSRPRWLVQPSRYEAISYCWYSPSKKKSICFGKQNIHVRERDHGGPLRQLRLVNENEILWNDALCLQLNRHEMKYRGNLRLGPLLSAGVSFVPEFGPFNDIDQFRFASRRVTFGGMSITSKTLVTDDWL